MKSILQHRLWTKPLTAILGLSFVIPFASAEARVTFKAPPNLGTPGRRVAGGARAPEQRNCLLEQKPLVAIVPQSNVVLTTLANPVLFFYIPPTSAPALELVVKDKKQERIFVRQMYKPSGKGGVVGLTLTKTSLEVGKEYRWLFSIVCELKGRSKDKVVEGEIRRINLEPQLRMKLENATPQERVNLYAEAGIWQDSLTNLAQLLFSRPNDINLKTDWKELLTAKGVSLEQLFAELLNQPLLQEQEAGQRI